MSKIEKLKEKLAITSNGFTFDEIVTLLTAMGFSFHNRGKTSGSRVCFTNQKVTIILHKPHPGNELKRYQIKQIRDVLQKEGLL